MLSILDIIVAMLNPGSISDPNDGYLASYTSAYVGTCSNPVGTFQLKVIVQIQMLVLSGIHFLEHNTNFAEI